jgi:putative transposase
MTQGFLYLIAIMDWHSRRMLAWRLSNTLDAGFCVEALTKALARFGAPEIFNTDRAVSSPALRSPMCLTTPACASAWTAAVAG